MCFSATASFTASAVLIVIGVVAIKKANHPFQLLFASIPFIFGIQQFSEGMLWMTLPNPEYENSQQLFTYIFLFFAQILWPIWIPIAILLVEKNVTRKTIQKGLVVAGLMVGMYLTYCLIMFSVEAKISGHHITYVQEYPGTFRNSGIIIYALATIVPTFFSHIKHMWMLGAIIAVSYLITAIFYDHYVLSVWCFFSSIISIAIYFIMTELAKAHKKSVTVRSQ